jgi:hypothetical protein
MRRLRLKSTFEKNLRAEAKISGRFYVSWFGMPLSIRWSRALGLLGREPSNHKKRFAMSIAEKPEIAPFDYLEIGVGCQNLAQGIPLPVEQDAKT